jgi:hypothetical protein
LLKNKVPPKGLVPCTKQDMGALTKAHPYPEIRIPTFAGIVVTGAAFATEGRLLTEISTV